MKYFAVVLVGLEYYKFVHYEAISSQFSFGSLIGSKLGSSVSYSGFDFRPSKSENWVRPVSKGLSQNVKMQLKQTLLESI